MVIKNFKQKKADVSIHSKLDAYTRQANTFCSTGRKKSQKSLLRNAYLAAITPLAAAALMPNTANAQVCITGASAASTLPRPNTAGTANITALVFDVDGDGNADAALQYAVNSAGNNMLLRVLVVPEPPSVTVPNTFRAIGSFTANPVNPYNYAANLANGANVSTLMATKGTGRILSVFNGVSYGNFLGGNNRGFVAFQANGNMGTIELTVNSVNNFILHGLAFEGMDGGTDGVGTAVLNDCTTFVTPLSVDLIKFNASAKDKNVVLSWKTASELNNSGFEIQRSADGKHFRKVGWMPGHDTTVEGAEYSFVDEHAEVNMVHYYRLKQMDNNGKFEYSDIQEVIIKDKNSIDVSNVYPNPVPAEATMRIRISLAEAADAQMDIYNQQGQVIQSLSKTLNSGNNPWDIVTSNMVAGNYFAKIQIGDKVVYKRFTVQ